SRVPLVGYVDRSFSRDILTMLSAFSGTGNAKGTALFDASLLRIRKADGRRQLDHWGDRTVFFYSRRIGLEAFRDAVSDSSMVGFTYLQTTSDSPPARLDIPTWVFEEGFLDETVDAIRAECVVGLGYPYILESADQAAVISAGDRDAFFRALQEFASREKLDFSVSRKDESKRRRR
ncbi:MAG: DNA double-strand break repair nuclease NurA, partial [Acidobacteriota bacterium]